MLRLSRRDLIDILSAPTEAADAALFARADAVRRRTVGDEVHLRGLIEVSNRCSRRCLYCGLRSPNAAVPRYSMTPDEVMAAAETAARLGYGTVVLQSGEDETRDLGAMVGLVRRIKRLGLAVTLSLGELPESAYAALREAGADRYLLKHETCNRALFRALKPDGDYDARIGALRTLKALGYQTGGGCMVGLPGQTFEDLAGDLALIAELDLDMAGIGPFIPEPGTPLGNEPAAWPAALRVRTTYRMMALLRLLRPDIMMPATTALATLDPDGRRNGLLRGANVLMPNVGALCYRAQYRIYPGKACLREDPATFDRSLKAMLASIGRRPGVGAGHCPRGPTAPAAAGREA